MQRSIHPAGTGTTPALSRLAILLAAGLAALSAPMAQAQTAAAEAAKADGSNSATA